MRTLLRRRAFVPAAVAIVVVAVASGATWYLLSGERRMGSVVERILVQRTGLPITVRRASWRGFRLILRDVRFTLAPALPLDVRVGELAIDSGLSFFLFPGRALSLEAKSPVLVLAEAPAVDPDALRSRLLAFLAWSGTLKVGARGAEIRTPGGATTFDLTGEKRGPELRLGMTVAGPGEGDPLRVDVRSAAALGRAVDLVVDFAGSPRALAALWPRGTPALLAARTQAQILVGGVVSVFGRFSMGVNPSDRVTLEVTARYDPASGDLVISRYAAVAWGASARLSGTGRVIREASGRRLTARGEGAVGGSDLRAKGSYDVTTGAFEIDLEIEGADAGLTAQGLATARPIPRDARRVHARLSGGAGVTALTTTVDSFPSRVPTSR